MGFVCIDHLGMGRMVKYTVEVYICDCSWGGVECSQQRNAYLLRYPPDMCVACKLTREPERTPHFFFALSYQSGR